MPPKKPIEIAKGLRFDETAATQTFGILARKGGGKTYLAGKLVEELHRVNCPVLVIDPEGNWWGLTLAADGKAPGLPFAVLGGERGDVELVADAGRAIAEVVVERALSAGRGRERIQQGEHEQVRGGLRGDVLRAEQEAEAAAHGGGRGSAALRASALQGSRAGCSERWRTS